jgi:hypothetical protein
MVRGFIWSKVGFVGSRADCFRVFVACQDQVKIHKWDEQSYYSLKASAEKSHAVLHRLVSDIDRAMERDLRRVILIGTPLSSSQSHPASCPSTCCHRERGRSARVFGLSPPGSSPPLTLLRICCFIVAVFVVAGVRV